MFMRITFHPRPPRFIRVAQHILRLRRTLKSMQQQQRHPLAAHRLRLPVAMTQNAALGRWIHFDDGVFGRRQLDPTRQKIRQQRLQIAISHPASRTKLRQPRRVPFALGELARIGMQNLRVVHGAHHIPAAVATRNKIRERFAVRWRCFGAASGGRTHDIRCHRPAFCH